MRLLVVLLAVFSVFSASGQSDSTRLLEAVIIDAYETNRRLDEVPVSVGVLDRADFDRYSDVSVLPAVNTIPGVRMEERSPGSYRFSIRGSSLRSPFGVRNVKVYWNGLPFTDGGGNTYLNLLDFASIDAMEIIKGPGGSLYGAGTGGVLLLKSPQVTDNQFDAGMLAGSYGLKRYHAGAQLRRDNVTFNMQAAHQRSDGYRKQTAFERTSLNAEVNARAGAHGSITAMAIYTDLFYQTPGGLTRQQYDEDPAQARPPTPVSLGAEDARAAVTNKTAFAGVVYDYDWDNRWNTTTGIYGAYTDFVNPTIRNYEEREETNFGLRTTTTHRIFRSQASIGGKIVFGGEYQHFVSPVRDYGNVEGRADTIQFIDKLGSRAGMLFAQADIELPGELFLTVGASVNHLRYNFLRKEPQPKVEQLKTFDVAFSPRVALLKRFSENISVFTSYSNGFSPPTLAEVRPSTNTFNRDMEAERGNNAEVGMRGRLLDRLAYDMVLYSFSLRNTIVVQRSIDGADWFVNAGRTSQRGVEVFLAYQFRTQGDPVSKIWASYAYQHYRFKDYRVQDQIFSGNKLTGVAPHVFSAGLDMHISRAFSFNLTANHVGEIPLNDGNDAFAESYTLLGLRVNGELGIRKKSQFKLFAGVDNVFDERYSLGNDLNAFGGRYFNAAMPRNYYGGLSFCIGEGKR